MDHILLTPFHALGFGILREHGQRIGLPDSFRIASEAERRALLCSGLKLTEHKAGQLLKRISETKRVGLAVLSEPGIAEGGALRTARPTGEDLLVVAAYDRSMRERGWVDFDDLIGLPLQLLEDHAEVLTHYRDRFRHVSVDEFQDLDARQYQLIRLLVPTGGNVCVIGDPDQSIYSFRGGEPRFFAQFTADYPTARTVQLRRNYRSGRVIVEGALQAIAPGSLVEGRVLEALNADAKRIVIHESPTDRAEAGFIVRTIEKLVGGHAFFSLDSGRVEGGETQSSFSFGDFAVLYRTDAQAEVLAEALARSGIPFRRYSHALLSEHPAVLAILEAARAVSADQSVVNRLKVAAEEAGASRRKPDGETPTGTVETSAPLQILTSLESLAVQCGHDFARFESELALLSDADLWDARADRVSLLTLHASKGLEFAVVFIVGCEDGLLPLRFSSDDANVAEERRLLFVGMTRARERLFLSHAKKRLWRGQFRQQNVSPFVAAIERELLESSKADFKRRLKPDAEQLDLFGS